MALLSRKGLLAIAAVIDVALYHRGRPVSAKALAVRHQLPGILPFRGRAEAGPLLASGHAVPLVQRLAFEASMTLDWCRWR
jgi:hypothetical protein